MLEARRWSATNFCLWLASKVSMGMQVFDASAAAHRLHRRTCNSTLALDDMDIIKSHEFLVQVNKMDLAVLYF